MQRLSPKNVLILWILLGMILVGSSAYITLLLQKKITAARSNIIDARVNIALSTQQKRNLSTLTQQFEKIKSDSEKLNNAFYDRTKPLAFVDRLEALATQFNLKEDEPKVDAPSRTRILGKQYSIEEKNWGVTLHGTTANLLSFLAKFEAEPTYVLINDITFQQSSTQEVTLQLQGKIPWY